MSIKLEVVPKLVIRYLQIYYLAREYSMAVNGMFLIAIPISTFAIPILCERLHST